MTLIGNLFLGIASLVSILILNLVYGNHNRGGDAGVGYAWSLILSLLVFVVCMGIVAISIGVKGGTLGSGHPALVGRYGCWGDSP